MQKFSRKILKEQEFFKVRKFTRKWDKQRNCFLINITYETGVKISPRTIKVAEAFGIGVDRKRKFTIYDEVELKITPRDIVYITGESGSGKSILLRALENDIKRDMNLTAINIDEIKPVPGEPIIETIGESFDEALELLSRVGLNDAFLFLRNYEQLSDGQKYRYKIAKMIESDAQFWIMDEFCATLDRDMAKIVAFNVQKQARRMGKSVLAATTHTDLFEDLAPSVHIHKSWGKSIGIRYYPNKMNRICSVTRNIRVEEGSLEDYKRLAEFHYRSRGHPPPLRIFALKRKDGETVGVILYSWPPVNIFGRKQALGRRLPLEEVNRKVAMISRVVLHPKYRSIGLGTRLVKETLPLVGRPYVETIAVMARYNPFFEKAGMKKIAERKPDKSVLQAVETLEKLGFKRYLLTSVEYNLEMLRRLTSEEIREIKKALIKTGHYKRLMASYKAYPKREEFKNWIKNQNLNVIANVLSRLAVLAETKVYLFWERGFLEEKNRSQKFFLQNLRQQGSLDL